MSERLCSYKVSNDSYIQRYPFTYLRFEFNGNQVLIKSANLAKFYRRMITSVKRKAQRAIVLSKSNPSNSVVVYRNQLIRLYSDISLDRYKIVNRKKTLKLTNYGYNIYHSELIDRKFKSNYFSYVRRSSLIMNQLCIEKQLRKHKGLFNSAISRSIKNALKKSS